MKHRLEYWAVVGVRALVRPLLDRSREEGLAYLRDLGLAWRDDPTSVDEAWRRYFESLPEEPGTAPAPSESWGPSSQSTCRDADGTSRTPPSKLM